MIRLFATLVASIQILLALRFAHRLWRTRDGKRISGSASTSGTESVSIILPVLNEINRVGGCLESLLEQGMNVQEILVVDGGSTDGTDLLINRYEQRDSRVRLVRTGPIPDDWNGKAFGLQAGLENSSPDANWILTVDADVRVSPSGVVRTLEFAESERTPALSVATTQRTGSPALSLIHPSLLSTLVYRFGVPGTTATTLDDVQANGQFALYDRTALLRVGGFSIVRDSICEDVTLARHLFLAGYQVGFFEGDDIAVTEMYPDAITCLRNWPRSLSLRDRFMPNAGLIGLLNLLFLQVVPLAVVASSLFVTNPGYLGTLNRLLLGTRIGILLGMHRAYQQPGLIYWLSPLFDPVSFLYYAMNLWRRTHVWRGRQLVSREL